MVSQNETKNEIAGLTKITVSDIGLDKPVLVKLCEQQKGKETPICRIVGQAVNMKAGTTDKGDYVRFVGLFQATNYLTPEIDYRSGNLILPNVASGMLEGLLGSAKAEIVADEKGESASGAAVVFGFEITVKGDPTAATGYVFGVRSLIKGKDPLEKLLAELPAIPQVKLLKK
jgi:hypothetical protein